MATASNTGSKNVSDTDLKILVVGDRKCGKSTFIEAFWHLRGLQSSSTSYAARRLLEFFPSNASWVYKQEYKIQNTKRKLLFCESDDSVEAARNCMEDHPGTNAVIIMYAIDDPTSFQNVVSRWKSLLMNDNILARNVCAVVVGNKKDLRDNREVIHRLAQNGQSPITVEQGESLIDNERIIKYFDCSSIEPNDTREILNWILSLGL